MKTGLVVTSTINHATPAVYAAHAAHRNNYDDIAAQEIGLSHPFGPMVDILFGGGRCYFKPRSDSGSCRSDDLDLFGFAEEHGYHVMQDRDGFDELRKGLGDIRIPFIGLFNDGIYLFIFLYLFIKTFVPRGSAPLVANLRSIRPDEV